MISNQIQFFQTQPFKLPWTDRRTDKQTNGRQLYKNRCINMKLMPWLVNFMSQGVIPGPGLADAQGVDSKNACVLL